MFGLGSTTTEYTTAATLAVGGSGKRIRLFSATWVSGAGADALVLANGTDGTTTWVTAAGTANASTTLELLGDGANNSYKFLLIFTACSSIALAVPAYPAKILVPLDVGK